MHTVPRSLTLLLCVLAAAPGTGLHAQQPSAQPVDAGGADVVVDFGADGERLADFLKTFQGLLQRPIDFLPEDVGGVVVHVVGPQRISRDRLRDAFDSLLDRHGFWNWDDVSGGSPQIVVRHKPTMNGRSPMPSFTARVITLDELGAGPDPRAPLYTVAFPLVHADARNFMTTLAASLDGRFEKIRNVDTGNVLVVTATRENLLMVRDIIAAADVPPPAPPATPELAAELAAIDARLTALEQRLAAVEAELKAGGNSSAR